MSIKAMNWAWEQTLAPSSKLILMALADAANEEGQCWPRIRLIAAKCCTSERTVQRVLKEFEHNRMLIVTPRFRPDGAQTSNGYRLDMQIPPDKLSPPSPARRREDDIRDTPGGATVASGGGDRALSPQEPPLNQKNELPLQPPSAVEVAELHFPLRLPMSERAAIETLLSGIPHAQAQELLDELAGALATQTIKTTPVRWFRGLVQRFRAGSFSPCAAAGVAERRRREEKAQLRIEAESTQKPASKEFVRAHLSKLNDLLTNAHRGKP